MRINIIYTLYGRRQQTARHSMDGMDPRLIALVNLQDWLETYLTLEIDDFPRVELANPLSYQR